MGNVSLPPPEMRIFVPSRAVFSRRSTLAPRLAARQEAMIPAAPAPTTITSGVMFGLVCPFGTGGACIGSQKERKRSGKSVRCPRNNDMTEETNNERIGSTERRRMRSPRATQRKAR